MIGPATQDAARPRRTLHTGRMPTTASPAPDRSSASDPPVQDAAWAAVILAGGASRRWGGRDKTAVRLAGRPLLQHVVDGVLPAAASIVVVAPADHPARSALTDAARRARRPLAWTREDPPGGGPCAGLAAGVTALAELAGPAAVPGVVVVLAGDLPFARTAFPRLVAVLAACPGSGPATGPSPEAALGRDPDGHRQPLLAAYRTAAVQRQLARRDPVGRSLRDLLAGLDAVDLPVTAEEALDLDSPADIDAAEQVLSRARS